MSSPDSEHLEVELERLYRKSDRDVDLSAFISDHEGLEDSLLAEVIEADGRLRLSWNRDVNLTRYLRAVPNLCDKPDALDAAIDVALRGSAENHRVDAAVVEVMIKRHPEIEGAIRDAAALNDALVSTKALREHWTRHQSRTLPCGFGPVLSDGKARYRLCELLGSGAFGQVYRAVDRQMSEADHEAIVAIKVLAGAGEDEWERQRMQEEATKARRIDHPNVVRVLDRGVSEEGEPYIVSEFVAGGDLAAWLELRGGRVDARQAAGLVARMARGVQAAHSAGLVHCDLKPGNIMMSSAGEPKVADFGIAARVGDDISADDAIRPLGNLAFIAPEQFRREPGGTSQPSDIYALGGILFAMITARLPNGATVEEIERTHDVTSSRTVAPSIAAHVPGVSGDLDRICSRAMSVRPADRHESAAALADDLESWLRHEPIRWMNPSPVRLLGLWVRRKPALAAVGALLLLSVCAGSVGMHMFRLDAQQEAHDKEMAELKAEELAQRKAERDAMLRDWRDRLVRIIQADQMPEAELLISTHLMEIVFGPVVMGDPGDRSEMWFSRVETTERLIAEAEAAGRGRDFETLTRQTQLALWYAKDGMHEQALPLIAHVRDVWQESLDPGDSWFFVLDVIEACATARRAHDDFTQDPTDAAYEELSSQAASLMALEAALDERRWGSPLHYLVMETLIAVHDARGLDDADKMATFDAKIATIWRKN